MRKIRFIEAWQFNKIPLIFLFGVIISGFTGHLQAQDVTPPAAISIRFVDVDPNTNHIQIRWNASTAVDCAGYYVYKLNKGYKTKIGSTNSATTNFTHLFVAPGGVDSSFANPNFWAEEFFVSAHDGPNESLLSEPHRTIHLDYVFKPCFGEIQLDWNHYVGFFQGVYEYEIFASINGGASSVVGSVDGNTNTFKHRNIEADKTYRYYIRATSKDGNFTSRSNAVQVYTDMPTPPVYLNANYATVPETNRINLEFSVDTAADETAYVIFRSSNGENGPWDTLAKYTPANLQGTILKHQDNINTNQIHFYKLQMINTCDVPFFKESNLCSNMLGFAESHPNLTHSIRWTNYKYWVGGVDFYEVHRLLGKDDMRIGVIPYGDTNFVDDMKAFFMSPEYAISINPSTYNPTTPTPNEFFQQPVIDGKVCYYIRAAETNNNPIGVVGKSNSDIFCLDLPPVVWIPNAFSPNNDGLNDVFMPFTTYSGWSNYQLFIYNRFGEPIFYTENPKEGWDGKNLSGKAIPPAIYIYKLIINGADGKVHEYAGQVNLLK